MLVTINEKLFSIVNLALTVLRKIGIARDSKENELEKFLSICL